MKSLEYLHLKPEGGTTMPSATLVGKEETFKALGLQSNQNIDLESLLSRMRALIEKESYDCENVGDAILEGLRDVRNGRIDKRHWRQVLDEI
jgi:hypothetical protein